MPESLESLERRIGALRAEVRRAVSAGDRGRGRALRAELREAEHAWSEAIEELDEHADDGVPARAAGGPVALLPVREQVHQALTLLGAPAAPRLIAAVHGAFFSGPLASARLTSIRRDEERSFRVAPFGRAYYLCAALTADLLAPARGLLAVSTWELGRRMIGPLSPRTDYLTAAVHAAEAVQRMPERHGGDALWLLRKFAANIPGAGPGRGAADPEQVIRAARAELAIHQDEDQARRAEAAGRARAQLSDAEQLFGTGLRVVPGRQVGA